MGVISVQSDISGAINKLANLRADVKTKAVPRALNKMIGQVKVQAAREIRDAGIKIKIGEIKKKLKITPANAGKLEASVTATGKPVPLIDCGAKQVVEGVSYDSNTGRKTLLHAFIATMPKTGHKGVFLRVGTAHLKVTRRGKTYYSGLPIKEQYAPSIPDTFAASAVQKALETTIREKFPAILDREIGFVNRQG